MPKRAKTQDPRPKTQDSRGVMEYCRRWCVALAARQGYNARLKGVME